MRFCGMSGIELLPGGSLAAKTEAGDDVDEEGMADLLVTWWKGVLKRPPFPVFSFLYTFFSILYTSAEKPPFPTITMWPLERIDPEDKICCL